MKIVVPISLMLLLFAVGLPAQTVAVHTVLVPSFLDDTNPVRFSPLNLLDGDPTTVFAVTFAKTDPVKPLVTLNLAEPVRLDGLRLKAGWFEEKQFRVYQRAKQVKLWVKLPSGALVPSQVFPLKDQMIAQDLVFTKPLEATAVYLSVAEVYPGTKNKDLVLSSLEGLAGGQALALERADHGTQVLAVTEDILSRRDDQGRLVYQSTRSRGEVGDRLTRILSYLGTSPQAFRESFLGPGGGWSDAWDLVYDGDSVRRVKVGDPTSSKKTTQTVVAGVPVLEKEILTEGGTTVENLYQWLPGDTRVPVIFRALSDEPPRVTSFVMEEGLPRVQTITWTN